MENHNSQPASDNTDKQRPQNISADTEALAKEKTDPLTDQEDAGIDRDEGNMDNGELGAGLKK